MPTLIDSLLVKLGLDSGDFDKGQKKVEHRLKETGKEADKAAKLVRNFLAVVGGTAAIKVFILDTIEASAAIERLSRNLEIGADTVSAWGNAAEIAGGSAAGLQGTMEMLSRSQTELMLTGQSGLVPYLSALGVAMADVHGKGRPVDDMLLDLADRFGKMDRATANNMGRMMGIDPGTMNLLLRGRAEVELMIKRQKEYGAITKQQAEEAEKFREQLWRGRQVLAAFGRELLSAVLPTLERLGDLFERVGDWMRQNKEFVSDFLTVMAVGLGAVALAVTPINLTVVAITALGAAIALLYQDYQTWQRGGSSLVPWEKFKTGVDLAKEAVKELRDMAGDAIYRMIAFGDAAWKAIHGDWKGARWALGEFANGAPASSPKGAPSDPMAFFMSKGWTRAQASGIVANLTRESKMDPRAIGDHGNAYGIGQWHPDRQANFKKWAGKDIRQSTLAEQLAFVDYELTWGSERKAGAALRGIHTGQEAGAAFSRLYERPADASGEARIRGDMAAALFRGVPGASLAAQGAGAGLSAASRAPLAAPNHSSVETHIGEVKVYTQATDADGIAGDMGKSLDHLFTSQANYGLS